MAAAPLRVSLDRSGYRDDVARLAAGPKDLHALALKAIDAARSAGATYADVRFTRMERQQFSFGTSLDPDQEELAVGVRALKEGYWGFSASPYWKEDEVVRLAREAVDQAKTSAVNAPKAVELGHYPVASGSWSTPIRIDPFTIPIEEKIDFMRSWLDFANQFRAGIEGDPGNSTMSFIRQQRVLASTEGAYCTQTLYETEGSFGVIVGPTDWRDNGTARVQAKGLRRAGKGWEMFLDAKLRDQLPQLVEEGDAMRKMTSKPVEFGRFDVLFDGVTMASLLDCTIGAASELDRAFGYTANDVGTSYLAPPLTMIGTYHAAAPIVNVTANRSTPSELATVKWDDDGVEPNDFTLVKDGVLVDYQTTRESTFWLAPYYQAHGLPVRSHGCSWADNAMGMQMLRSPNLVMNPSSTDATLDSMVADVKQGLAIFNGDTQADFQGGNGNGPGSGVAREIKDGKLGAVVNNVSFVFNAPDLWRSVVAIGGASTVEAMPMERYKGRPLQRASHTVSAPAAIVKNLAILDRSRSG